MKPHAVVVSLVLLATLTTRALGAELSASDHELLSRLVLAEAGNEGTLGMALVARSVLNRSALIQSGAVRAGSYLSRSGSIHDVIHGRRQYQPVSNGTIRRARSAAELAQAREAIALAQDTDALRKALEQAGVSAEGIQRLLSATGFRARTAFNDPSQNYARQRLGNHVFNADKHSLNQDVPALFARYYGQSSGAAGALTNAFRGMRSDSDSALPASAPRGDAERRSQPASQPLSQPASQPLSQPASQPVSQPLSQPVSQPLSKPVSQPLSQPVSQPLSQPVSQPLSKTGDEPSSAQPPSQKPTALRRRVEAAGPLEFGARGSAVDELQRRLGIKQTGLLGPTTTAALKDWQRANGLEPTGVVSKADLDALDRLAPDLRSLPRSRHEAYEGERSLGPIDVVELVGVPVGLEAARAFLRMRAAAARDGVTLRLVRGFHAREEEAMRPAAASAVLAPPCRGNHESGRAIDLETPEGKVLEWLELHAARFRFRRTTASEPAHWEYTPPAR
ncbi:MAG: peptidoglycan-binding protein [Planctomycetota bacterium]